MDISLVGRSPNVTTRITAPKSWEELDPEFGESLNRLQMLATCCRVGGRLTGAVGLIGGLASIILAATSPDMSPQSRTAAYAGGGVAIFVGLWAACFCGRTPAKIEVTYKQTRGFNSFNGV